MATNILVDTNVNIAKIKPLCVNSVYLESIDGASFFFSPGNYTKVSNWINENCIGYWYSEITLMESVFKFSDSKDALLFKMRWS